MGYAIIRNAKYKMSNMQSISRHNERQNKEYGNEDIDPEKKDLNYHLKQPQERSYEREFERLRLENDLKGNLRLTGKKQSNVACEFLITSDNDFFRQIGEAETKRYFEEAYRFVSDRCGEKNIISAVIHMDETTPHMHVTYIPVVEGKNRQGEPIEKVNCSEFWKGFNSYGKLQDTFYERMTEKGFNLERGERTEGREERREHLSVDKFKQQTLKEQIVALETERTEAKNLLTRLDTKINELHQEEIRTVGQLKINSKEIDSMASIKVSHNEINAIEGKPVPLSGGKVVVTSGELAKLKNGAIKSSSLEYQLENVMGELQRTKNREDKMEKFAERLKQENTELRGMVQELRGTCRELSDKQFIAKKILTKYGLEEEKADSIIEGTYKQLQEKQQDMQKTPTPKIKDMGMER